MPPRFRLPNRLPLPRRVALWNRADRLARGRTRRQTISPTSARVSASARKLSQDAAVLWWRWRHNFLEAKRLELQARHEEGR